MTDLEDRLKRDRELFGTSFRMDTQDGLSYRLEPAGVMLHPFAQSRPYETEKPKPPHQHDWVPRFSNGRVTGYFCPGCRESVPSATHECTFVSHSDIKGVIGNVCLTCGKYVPYYTGNPADVLGAMGTPVSPETRAWMEEEIPSRPRGESTPVGHQPEFSRTFVYASWLAKMMDRFFFAGGGIARNPGLRSGELPVFVWPLDAPQELPAKTHDKSSKDSFFGRSTIWDVPDGAEGTRSPYMTRYWIGRLRLHIFYRGDGDPDPHDHPWDFWTFPLTSYVEEVTHIVGESYGEPGGLLPIYETYRRVVRAFRLHFRPATHTHRVLGRLDRNFEFPGSVISGETGNPAFKPGKIVTIVWRSGTKREWGFLKNRDGRWCWVGWNDYVFGKGKNAPCGPQVEMTEAEREEWAAKQW